MNIFVTSPCPIKSARFLDDKRVNKMATETAQMLCTAIWHHKYRHEWPLACFRDQTLGDHHKAQYKANTGLMLPAYLNHPCTVWVRETQANFWWTLTHFVALLEQYKLRQHKTHGTERVKNILFEEYIHVPDGKLTEFANCSPYKTEPIHEAYLKFMSEKWKNDKRQPLWFGEPINV